MKGNKEERGGVKVMVQSNKRDFYLN